MKMFRYDSPIMEFMRLLADFIILNILWLVCSIPIVTAGAATSAKYAGSMRIVRHEETPVFSSFFKDFKENFKQATIIWLGLMVVIAICSLDILWIRNKGLDSVPSVYKVAIGILSFLVLGVCMTVFPFIARFEVKNKEALKAAVIFTIIHFVRIGLIILLEAGTAIACFWYMRWLPLIGIFGTTTAFYFNTILLVKEFKKTEDNLEGNAEGNAEGNVEENPQ